MIVINIRQIIIVLIVIIIIIKIPINITNLTLRIRTIVFILFSDWSEISGGKRVVTDTKQNFKLQKKMFCVRAIIQMKILNLPAISIESSYYPFSRRDTILK